MTLFYVMAIMAWVYTYDMDSVHNWEPERSRVTIIIVLYKTDHKLSFPSTTRHRCTWRHYASSLLHISTTGNIIILEASSGHILLDPYMGDRAYILMVLFLTIAGVYSSIAYD